MWDSEQYELLDFGDGRKLERWGGYLVDRPAPAATGRRQRRRLWSQAAFRFERSRSGQAGVWSQTVERPTHWTVRWHDRLAFELHCGTHGQLGVFPEQATNWEWLAEGIAKSDAPLSILNLFAYTGGATMAAASAGAVVTHVDAASSMVKRARRNAELSSLGDASIRWIVDDALAFVKREIRRGRRYDGVVLDPPAYGHGGKKKAWRLERDLSELLRCCWEVTGGAPRLWLLSCHVPDWGPEDLAGWLARRTGLPLADPAHTLRLDLQTSDHRRLYAGVALRYRDRQ